MNKNDLDVGPSDKIKRELLSWKGVILDDHNFVTIFFYVKGAEMGHLHGDSIADLKFPEKVSRKLVKDGYVSRHHVIPKSGWVSHEIRHDEDVEKVIELFRLQYDRLGK